MNKILIIFLGFLTFIGNPAIGAASNQPSAESIYSVWSVADADRTTNIWYSWRSGKKWVKPIRLEIEQGVHVTPVIASDPEGTIWFVWIEQTTEASMLRFARVHNGFITEKGRVLAGVGEQSYAPAIVLDGQGQPWIAWSGVVGNNADIFASRWVDNAWVSASQVNLPNNTPDITPIMGIRDKGVWVSWFGFEKTHRYVQFVAMSADAGWTVDKKVLPSIDVKAFIKARTATEFILPEQAAKRLMGAVFSGSANEIQSVTERFMKFQTEVEK